MEKKCVKGRIEGNSTYLAPVKETKLLYPATKQALHISLVQPMYTALQNVMHWHHVLS